MMSRMSEVERAMLNLFGWGVRIFYHKVVSFALYQERT